MNLNDEIQRYLALSRHPLFADTPGHSRNWRLAQLGAQDKLRVEAEQGLILNFRLLSADPILQTTIHLRPLTVLIVDFVGGLGYLQTARGGPLQCSTSRTA